MIENIAPMLARAIRHDTCLIAQPNHLARLRLDRRARLHEALDEANALIQRGQPLILARRLRAASRRRKAGRPRMRKRVVWKRE